MNQKEIKKFILDNLDRHKQFALGTVDETGKPWAVCLNLAYDDRFNIIWKSAKNAEHSRHVRANPDVAICIFSESPEVGDFGLYIKARASDVTDPDELRRLIDVRFTKRGKPTPGISSFQGDASDRLYYAEIHQMWLNADDHIKRTVDLESLRDE